MTASVAAPQEQGGPAVLTAVDFGALPGFSEDDHREAFAVFANSCGAIAKALPPLRPAVLPSAALQRIAQRALAQPPLDRRSARLFFKTHFRPYRIGEEAGRTHGFLTGYYEPILDGSLEQSAAFPVAVLGPPEGSGALTPCPDRAAIEAGALSLRSQPVVYVRERVELFLAQVQGSARVRLTDGRWLRLAYAGRNGHPYTSIGRLLIESGEIAASAMSLAALKSWIRGHGQNPGEAGFVLMQRNKSYIFFAVRDDLGLSRGPIGGQGISLAALRSVAPDRSLWSYGLPFWIAAELPWRTARPELFRRLMIAQDTGSAILGQARFDVFFGTGDDAGARAGDIRHDAQCFVLLPAKEA